MNRPITQRENFLRAIRHEDPMWIPLNSDCQLFAPEIIPDNVARGMLRQEAPFNGTFGGPDMFGVEWVFEELVGGSMVVPGNPKVPDISEWRKYITIPDVDSWDWEGCAAANQGMLNCGKYINGLILSGLFERLISWLDFDNALFSLIDEDETEYVHEIFGVLVEVYKKIIFNSKKYFNIDGMCLHDDWGAQKAPFFSPAMCREMIAPYMKQIVDYAHSLGVTLYHHCCGNVGLMVPIMIECGIDQWDGQEINDKAALIKEYGDKILIGSSDTLSAIPGQREGLPADKIPGAVNEYFKEYGWDGQTKGKLFYLMNKRPDETIIDPFTEKGLELMK